jgi:hypothetical protein
MPGAFKEIKNHATNLLVNNLPTNAEEAMKIGTVGKAKQGSRSQLQDGPLCPRLRPGIKITSSIPALSIRMLSIDHV